MTLAILTKADSLLSKKEQRMYEKLLIQLQQEMKDARPLIQKAVKSKKMKKSDIEKLKAAENDFIQIENLANKKLSNKN